MSFRNESRGRLPITVSVRPWAFIAESVSAKTVYPFTESMIAGSPTRLNALLNNFKEGWAASDGTMLIPVKGILSEGRIGESEDFRQDEKRPANISNNNLFIINSVVIVV